MLAVPSQLRCSRPRSVIDLFLPCVVALTLHLSVGCCDDCTLQVSNAAELYDALKTANSTCNNKLTVTLYDHVYLGNSSSPLAAARNSTHVYSPKPAPTGPFEPVTDTLPYDLDDYSLLLTNCNVVIRGNCSPDPFCVIDGNHTSQILKIHNCSAVTLENVRLQNGRAFDGGCIGVSSSTLLALNNVSFKSCLASNRGGALHAEQVSSLKIHEASVTNCSCGAAKNEISSSAGGAFSFLGIDEVSIKGMDAVFNSVFGPCEECSCGHGRGGFLHAKAQNKNSTITLDSVIVSNSSSCYGDAISLTASNATLEAYFDNVDIEYTQAGCNGSGLSINDDVGLKVPNSSVHNSSAGYNDLQQIDDEDQKKIIGGGGIVIISVAELGNPIHSTDAQGRFGLNDGGVLVYDSTVSIKSGTLQDNNPTFIESQLTPFYPSNIILDDVIEKSLSAKIIVSLSGDNASPDANGCANDCTPPSNGGGSKNVALLIVLILVGVFAILLFVVIFLLVRRCRRRLIYRVIENHAVETVIELPSLINRSPSAEDPEDDTSDPFHEQNDNSDNWHHSHKSPTDSHAQNPRNHSTNENGDGEDPEDAVPAISGVNGSDVMERIDGLPDEHSAHLHEQWTEVVEMAKNQNPHLKVIANEELKCISLLGSGAMKQVTKELWRDSEVAVARLLSLPVDPGIGNQENFSSNQELLDFANEIALLIQLVHKQGGHPNIPQIYGITADQPGVVMELIRDGSLKNYRKKRQEKFIVTPSDLQGNRPIRKLSWPRSSIKDKTKPLASNSSRRTVENNRNGQDTVESPDVGSSSESRENVDRQESPVSSLSPLSPGINSSSPAPEPVGNEGPNNQAEVFAEQDLLQLCKLEKYLFRLRIALEAANGVEYLHRHDIIHFDLKLDNFLVEIRGGHPTIKIVDMGLSKRIRSQENSVSGGARGTLPWTAPELLDSTRLQRVDEKVDVYSFGVCLWELFTGTPPYQNHNKFQLIYEVLNDRRRPEIPPDCEEAFSNLMQRCWEQSPQDRPSFKEIVALLEGEIKTCNRQIEDYYNPEAA